MLKGARAAVCPSWLSVLIPALGLLGSCQAPLDTGSAEDYIGPTHGAAAGVPAVPAASGPTSRPAASEPLSVTVAQAILLALENNRSLIVQRYTPPIRRTTEQQLRAVFDPDLTAQFTYDRARSEPPHTAASFAQDYNTQIGLTEFLPTGTQLGLTGNVDSQDFTSSKDTHFISDLNLTATQSLMRGFGVDVNLASLRQARIDTESSEYELRGFVQSLVAQTEEAYWDYTLAQRQIEIFNQSLELAKTQLNDTRVRIRVGKLAETELAAAEAEVALRQEGLIQTRSSLAQARLTLLRLLSPPGGDAFDRELIVEDQPDAPQVNLDPLEEHIRLALQLRPDLNQARLQVLRGDLEIVKTRNGLLPKLDLFVTLGRTGYADSFGPSIRHLDENDYNLRAGVSMEIPPINRDARARYARSVLGRSQSLDAVSNLAQLVEQDVRSAYIEIQRTQEQMIATAATRKFQQEKLRAETERFNVQKSTTLLVGIAQRDFQNSQLAEIQVAIGYLKALVELYRLEGSILERRGLQAPGAKPVKLPD